MGITWFEFMCIQQKIEPSVLVLSVVPTTNFLFFLFVICQKRKDLQSWETSWHLQQDAMWRPLLVFVHNHVHQEFQRGSYPIANTCINCLKIPLYKSYDDFKRNMDFAIQNTQGFGME